MATPCGSAPHKQRKVNKVVLQASRREGLRQKDLLRLQERSKEIIRLAVVGMSARAIADHLGITTQTVSNTLNSPIARDFIAVLSERRNKSAAEVGEEIKVKATQAVATLAAVMEGKIDGKTSDKVRASIALLDRAGFGPVHTVRGEHLHGVFTKDDLDELRRRKEAALRHGNAVASEGPQGQEGIIDVEMV